MEKATSSERIESAALRSTFERIFWLHFFWGSPQKLPQRAIPVWKVCNSYMRYKTAALNG